ncbi:MAG: hypothetical protein HZA52_13800 [Planctomycetes bacterium]|nr:hypothetical protein [Planctomycetota bacterium]
MRRQSIMQALARHRAERPEAVAVVGYRGQALALERWIGIVLWGAFLAVLIAASN